MVEEGDNCPSDNDVVAGGGATRSCKCCHWGGERVEVVEVHTCSL